MKYQFLYFVVLSTILIFSCSKEGAPEDGYFYASIDGPSWNGEFRIEGKAEELVGQAVITPSSDPEIPDVLLITYNDSEENIAVSISVPAEERKTELTDDHNVFGMSMASQVGGEEDVTLISKTLSMDITELKTTSGGVFGLNIPSTVVGNFTGVMIYEKYENGQRIEEVHTAHGDFKYYSH